MYRALSLLSSHIDDIQAQVWKNSQKIMSRNTRVVYYDCTNYYFEIEDNDLAKPDADAPNRCVGIRRRGKSKEHRPNPIVQMGMLMDSDGIPLSFIIFPGNESEQPTLKKVEEMIADKFGLNDFIISTDAGLSSEDNRRYNMTENREYIAVQSLPSLSEADQAMALDPKGWHIAFRDKHLSPINPENPSQDTFNLKQINLGREKDTTFYKEIIVSKCLNGKKSTARDERVIVTYNHGFALYLKQKREERLKVAEKIVKNKQVNSRASQQDPRNYVDTVYYTPEGEVAEGITMSINTAKIAKEERFDGFYAYGTSLDDDAIDVLRARSFHYEIEHLFRTTKSHLEARPVYLQREERIRSHFLVCFLSMVIIKMLQKQINMPDVSIDRLIQTLRSIKFDYFKGYGYRPLFERNNLTDRLQEVAQVNIDTQIVEAKTMRAMYRALNKS
jgi:transposase